MCVLVGEEWLEWVKLGRVLVLDRVVWRKIVFGMWSLKMGNRVYFFI